MGSWQGWPHHFVDFDADDVVDICFAKGEVDGPRSYCYQGLGDGTFGPRIYQNLDPMAGSWQGWPFEFVDFNADSIPDACLPLGTQEGPQTYCYEGLGDGTFGPRIYQNLDPMAGSWQGWPTIFVDVIE